jgi:hypothetical protein
VQREQADRLAELRAHWHLPPDLEGLAREAAKIGLLCDADDAAHVHVECELASSSQPSATVPAWRMPPDGLYANYPNVEATYYDALRRELLRVLGRSD